MESVTAQCRMWELNIVVHKASQYVALRYRTVLICFMAYLSQRKCNVVALVKMLKLSKFIFARFLGVSKESNIFAVREHIYYRI